MKARETIWICDACGSRHVGEADGEAPDGYHFRVVQRITPTGGDTVRNVYACSADCVLRGLDAAFQRSADK